MGQNADYRRKEMFFGKSRKWRKIKANRRKLKQRNTANKFPLSSKSKVWWPSTPTRKSTCFSVCSKICAPAKWNSQQPNPSKSTTTIPAESSTSSPMTTSSTSSTNRGRMSTSPTKLLFLASSKIWPFNRQKQGKKSSSSSYRTSNCSLRRTWWWNGD